MAGGMGPDRHFARQQSSRPNVRFGPKADISECPRDVRFTPKSGHWLSVSQCPLCAKSGHSARLRPSAGPVAPRAAVDVGDQRPGLIAPGGMVRVHWKGRLTPPQQVEESTASLTAAN